MIFGRKDNYLSLGKKLAERTAKVAKLIRSKIENLGSIFHSEFDNGEITYETADGKIGAVKIESNGYIKYLAVLEADYNNQQQDEWCSLEHMGGLGPVLGILEAQNKYAISFLMASRQIIDHLDRLDKEFHAKEMEEMECALKYTNSLV